MTNTYPCGSMRLERATPLDRWRAHRTLVINGRGAGAFTQPCRLQSAGVCDPAEVFRYRGTLSAHTTRDPDLRALLCGGPVGPLPVCVPAVCLAWPCSQAASRRDAHLCGLSLVHRRRCLDTRYLAASRGPAVGAEYTPSPGGGVGLVPRSAS